MTGGKQSPITVGTNFQEPSHVQNRALVELCKLLNLILLQQLWQSPWFYHSDGDCAVDTWLIFKFLWLFDVTLSGNFLSLVSWLLSNYVNCFIVNYYDNYDSHHDFTTVMVNVQLILQLSSNFYGYLWLYLLNYLQLVLSPHHDCLNLMYKDQITTQGSLHHTLCNLEFNELRYQKLISFPTHYQQSAHCRPTVGPLSANR